MLLAAAVGYCDPESDAHDRSLLKGIAWQGLLTGIGLFKAELCAALRDLAQLPGLAPSGRPVARRAPSQSGTFGPGPQPVQRRAWIPCLVVALPHSQGRVQRHLTTATGPMTAPGAGDTGTSRISPRPSTATGLACRMTTVDVT